MTLQEMYNIAVATPTDINEHLSTLLRYGKECKHITEMGVRTGRSTLAWLMATPSTLICYDLHVHKNFDLAQYNKWAKEQNIDFSFIEGDTRNVTIKETDLLFIDTLHTYPQLKIELSLHADKAKKYIILHDTTTFGEKGEVKGQRGLNQALTEFLSQKEEWAIKEIFSNNNGLTILERT